MIALCGSCWSFARGSLLRVVGCVPFVCCAFCVLCCVFVGVCSVLPALFCLCLLCVVVLLRSVSLGFVRLFGL